MLLQKKSVIHVVQGKSKQHPMLINQAEVSLIRSLSYGRQVYTQSTVEEMPTDAFVCP